MSTERCNFPSRKRRRMMKLEMGSAKIGVLMLLPKEQWKRTTSMVRHKTNCKKFKESFPRLSRGSHLVL
jgi:hypothetical protein